MKIKRVNLLTVILAVLCAIALAIGVSFVLPKSNNGITASAATEMYDASAPGNISKTGLKELAQAAGYNSYSELCKALQSGNKNATDFGGAIVTFGGKSWYAVYLTGSTTGAILTLWHALSVAGTPFSDTTSNNSASTSIKSNDYSNSWIRSAINAGNSSNGGYFYGKWNNASTACTPTIYDKSGYNGSTLNSTMYCPPTSFTHFSDFVTGTYSSVVVAGAEGDKVWLPSTDEAASGGSWGCVTGMWGSDSPWTRTARTGSQDGVSGLNTSGSDVRNSVKGTFGVRPAINISLPLVVDAPEDVEATYTGSILSIADAAADKKEWYDASLMDLTYPTANTTDMIDADTYKVKVELNSTAIAAGYLFSGDPDTGKGETDTLRYFDFKINPKKLTIPKITNSPLTYDPVNGSHFAVDTNFDPTTMTGVGVTTGITWNSASNCFDATNAGTYSVKFQLKDTKNYVWDVGASGTTADQPTTVKVEPIKLTIPTITAPQEYSGSVLQFVLADFNSGTNIKVDSATGTGGNTVTGASGAAITDTTDTFEATNVGIYTVALSLRDTTNYAWSDGVSTSKNVQFEITQKELLSAPPVSSEVNGTGGAEWKFGDTATITITDARISGENINLLVYYDVAGGTSKANTLTGTFDGVNTTTITMPTNIAVGKYTLTVELNGSTGDNANYKITKNNTLNFEVTSGKLDPSTYDWTYTKDGAAGGTSKNDGSLKLPFELKPNNTLDGVKYELSIQIPTADAGAVQVDTSKYVNGYQTRSGDKVGTFKTTVALKSVDPDFKFEVGGVMQSTCEVEFSWEIEKGDFDLTNVKWEYSLTGNAPWTEYDSSNPPQYNDGYDITIRVKASTLPRGLTLDSLYTGIDESDVNNYTATIQVSDFKYNTTNFNAPDVSKLDLNWEIAKKNLYSGFKNAVEPFTNANYSGNIIIKELNLDPAYAGYIDYVYYDNLGNPISLQDIKDAVDLTNPQNYKVEAYIKPAYAANYEVDDNGSTPSDNFTTGSSNKLATVTIDGADGSLPITAEYDGNTHFDSSLVKITSDTDGLDVSDFTVKYYKGTTATAANELPAGELPKDAGDYCVEIILGTQAAKKYILAKETIVVTVEAKGIDLPTLGTITFNGKEQNFADNLSGSSWTTYGPKGMDIIKVDGKLSDRNVGAGTYITTLELTDTNYKWIYPSSKSGTKYSLTADEVKVTGDDVTATYNWNIQPLIVDTTNMWNKGSKGATLKLPQNIRDLIAGGTLEVGYRYYSNGEFVEEPELKGGRSFKVEAVFAGDDAERNVQFKRSNTEFGAVSKDIDYTVPQTGAAVFFGNVKEALTTSYAGLPLWAWLLIALALLILLIVIIVVCVKRRKTKEEKEEIKARKQEEKERREEERRLQQERLEEERRLQREKLEAERELARAKQEAELEKIRAQAQAGMAGAGMASMAMAQPQQQAMPTQMPVQTVDNDFLKEMRQQMAELRADNKATQAQLQALQNNQHAQQQPAMMPMAQPMYQQYPQYQQMPMQMPMPMGMGGYGGSDSNALARMEAQLNAMQAEQRARYDAEQRIELAAMRAEQHVDRDSRHSVDLAAMREHYSGNMGYNRIPDYSNQQSNNIDALGAIVAAALKNIAGGEVAATQAVPELPQKSEQEPVAKYPSDAVITTTTTVDTTKNKPLRREENENFDIDGFYDPLD